MEFMFRKLCLTRMASSYLVTVLRYWQQGHSLPSRLYRPSLVRFGLRAAATASLTLAVLVPAHAGLFNDDEARQAILDLRARTTSLEGQLSAAQQALLEQNNQIAQLQRQTASLRGQNEELTNQLTILQKTVKE